MPSVWGILISVTTTSYRALSSFFFAASPEFTVSILWPSRRRAISSISQMERSSSHTRMLPMRSTSDPGRGCDAFSRRSRSWHFGNAPFLGDAFCNRHPAQPQDENAALPYLGAGPHLAFMRLDNLIHDGQTQPGAAFKLGLEGFKNLLHQLPAHAWSGVGEVDLPVVSDLLQRNCEDSPRSHGADCVLAKVPEHLFDLVAIGQGKRVGKAVAPFDPDARVLRYQPMFQQGERVFNQRQKIDRGELILLAPGVRQKIGNNAVQPFRLTYHNLQQLAVFVAQIGDARE